VATLLCVIDIETRIPVVHSTLWAQRDHSARIAARNRAGLCVSASFMPGKNYIL